MFLWRDFNCSVELWKKINFTCGNKHCLELCICVWGCQTGFACSMELKESEIIVLQKKKKKVHQCYVTSSSKNYKSKTFVQVAAILNWWCFVLFKQSWSDHASELFPFFFFLPGVDHIVLHSLSFLLCLVAHINSTACYNKCNLVTKKPDFISAYTRWWLFCHRRIVLS